MAPPSAPQDLRAVVAQMYRADWTTLSLSATVTVRTMRRADLPCPEMSHRVLLAPGGKYRISPAPDPGQVHEVCDGSPPGSSWGAALEAGADAGRRLR